MIDHGKQMRGDAASTSSTSPATPVNTTSDVAGSASPTLYATPDDKPDISYFYGALAPYGTWREDATYGWVWQPREVTIQTEWRPYVHAGHWVWTDSGWYWESDYPWGWAAFHYGRWHHSPEFSWVWVPDTVWGPSWVSWRHSDAYYGWAPLPPEARFEAGVGFSFHSRHVGFNFDLDFGLGAADFAFVPAGGFLEADLAVVQVPRTRVTNVYKETTIIKNTYVNNGNLVVNNGVPVSQVATSTNRKIEAVHVTDATYRSGQAITRGEQRNGNRIMAYRPTIRNSVSETPPAVIKRQQATTEKAAERTLSEELRKRRTPTPTTSRSTTSVESSESSARNRLIEEKAQRRSRQNDLLSNKPVRRESEQFEPLPGRSQSPKAIERKDEERSKIKEEPAHQAPQIRPEPNRSPRETRGREIDERSEPRSEKHSREDR
jgi:hypothetical protein